MCWGSVNAPDAGLDACHCAKPHRAYLTEAERLTLIGHIVDQALAEKLPPHKHAALWHRIRAILRKNGGLKNWPP